MPSFSHLLNAASVIFVIVVAFGAWRYGGGRRSRDGSMRGGDYSAGWTNNSPGSQGHDGGSGGHDGS